MGWLTDMLELEKMAQAVLDAQEVELLAQEALEKQASFASTVKSEVGRIGSLAGRGKRFEHFGKTLEKYRAAIPRNPTKPLAKHKKMLERLKSVEGAFSEERGKVMGRHWQDVR